MDPMVLVACGSGIATSTHVATVLRERLAARGVPITTRQCRVQDVPENLSGISLVVTTGPTQMDVGIPVVNGVPFLTGIGAEGALDTIENLLKKAR